MRFLPATRVAINSLWRLARSRGILQAAFALAPFIVLAFGQTDDLRPDDPYFTARVSDPVSSIAKRVNDGTLKLAFEPGHGYLKSLLKELGLPYSSQILAFSKTSLQTAYISPQSPRAIYFDDHAYLAWIPGAPNIEMIGIDPQIGPVFYTLQNRLGSRPQLVRKTFECLQCHASAMTIHVPGLIKRSVYTTADGTLRLAGGSFLTTAKSPMKERWGGWYVTGTHGGQRHMGNEISRGDDKNPIVDEDKGANVTDLRQYFDVEDYLAPSSDIVALMVVEQQMEIQNLITKAGMETREALKYADTIRKAGFPEAHVADTIRDRVGYACEPLVEALLCVGEAKLTAPVKGTSSFAATYSASSPADGQGRRLSELDLKTRLLKYPCSPMIYSSAFAGLPDVARAQVLRRLREVLSGKDQSPMFAGLSAADRKSVLDILDATLPAFRSNSWKV